jgi:O-succinylbenzoic acid--CoA ligase
VSMSSWCCLPLNHVGGMMQIIRAASTGGKVFFFDYRSLYQESLGSFFENQWISLVPTQLHRLIESPVACENLRRFRGIFMGGAALPLRLAQKCRFESLPLYPSYGMSETAGMITLLDANSFLNGIDGVGNTLPHAQISVDSQRNCFLVKSKSMCLNHTEFSSMSGGWLTTPDYGYQNEDGNWFVQGRLDCTIITGGEKVNPREIEQVLGQFESVRECVVYGIEDEEWGQCVVAYISPTTINIQKLKDFAKRKLASHSIPKEWYLVEELPLSAMGKPLN